MRPRLPSAAIAIVLSAGFACAQPAPDDGLEWRTIGAPGNRAALPAELPMWPELVTGSVDYEYRLMQTEITTSQYYEFLTAYNPHSGGLFDLTQIPLTDFYPTRRASNASGLRYPSAACRRRRL